MVGVIMQGGTSISGRCQAANLATLQNALGQHACRERNISLRFLGAKTAYYSHTQRSACSGRLRVMSVAEEEAGQTTKLSLDKSLKYK
jgi:hypothetical protein